MTIRNYYRGGELSFHDEGKFTPEEMKPYIDSIDFFILSEDINTRPVLLRPVFLN